MEFVPVWQAAFLVQGPGFENRMLLQLHLPHKSSTPLYDKATNTINPINHAVIFIAQCTGGGRARPFLKFLIILILFASGNRLFAQYGQLESIHQSSRVTIAKHAQSGASHFSVAGLQPEGQWIQHDECEQ